MFECANVPNRKKQITPISHFSHRITPRSINNQIKRNASNTRNEIIKTDVLNFQCARTSEGKYQKENERNMRSPGYSSSSTLPKNVHSGKREVLPLIKRGRVIKTPIQDVKLYKHQQSISNKNKEINITLNHVKQQMKRKRELSRMSIKATRRLDNLTNIMENLITLSERQDISVNTVDVHMRDIAGVCDYTRDVYSKNIYKESVYNNIHSNIKEVKLNKILDVDNYRRNCRGRCRRNCRGRCRRNCRGRCCDEKSDCNCGRVELGTLPSDTPEKKREDYTINDNSVYYGERSVSESDEDHIPMPQGTPLSASLHTLSKAHFHYPITPMKSDVDTKRKEIREVRRAIKRSITRDSSKSAQKSNQLLNITMGESSELCDSSNTEDEVTETQLIQDERLMLLREAASLAKETFSIILPILGLVLSLGITSLAQLKDMGILKCRSTTHQL